MDKFAASITELTSIKGRGVFFFSTRALATQHTGREIEASEE